MYENINQPEAMRERYKALPPEVTELFEYGTVDFVLDNIVHEFALGDEQKDALRMEIELVLYFFLPRIGFVERLQDSLEIDTIKAGQIYAYVEENLFVIVDDILTFTDKELSLEEEVETTPQVQSISTQQSVAPAPLPPSGLPSFITKEDAPSAPKTEVPTAAPVKENPYSQVKPLRTFAQDVELSRAHSYGAFRGNTPKDGDDDEEPVHRSSQDDIIKK